MGPRGGEGGAVLESIQARQTLNPAVKPLQSQEQMEVAPQAPFFFLSKQN